MGSLLLFPTLVWGLPGWLAARRAFPERSGLERLALAAVLGMALMVPSAFAWSFLQRRMLTPEALLGLSATWSLLFLAWARLRPAPPRASAHTATTRSGERGLVVATLGVALAFTFAEAPRAVEASEVWAPCPHQSAFYLIEDGRGAGVEAWDAIWGLRVTHLMEHALEPGYGMKKVLTYQRVGSTATLVQPVAFFGSGGFVVATFIYYFLVLVFGTLLARGGPGLRQGLVGLGVSTAFLLGVRAIAVYTVNENVLALGLSMATLHLVRTRLTRAQAALAGAVFALCLATRPMCVGLVPALAWFLLRDRNWRSAAIFAAVIPICAAAFLAAHHQLFGVAVTDPSLFQVRTRHEFLGATFTFHPLIWPFSGQVVRSANEPFPLLLQVPLEHLWAFGALLSALIACGVALGPRRDVLPALLWALPGYALLMALVSLDHHKLSYALTAVGALPWLAGMGLRGLFGAAPTWRRALAATLALGVTVALPLAARPLQFPVDPRRQYNDEVGAWDDPSLAQKVDRLTRPALLPRFAFDTGTIGLAWDLLRHARWAPRRDGQHVESPVFVWKQLPEIRTTFTAMPSDQLLLPPYLGDLEGGLELTDSLAVFALHLPLGETQVAVGSDGHRLLVEVTTASQVATPGSTGWLTVGLVDDGIENVQEVELLMDGEHVRPTFQTLQIGSGPPHLRVVANHPLKLEPTDDGGTLGFELTTPNTAPADDQSCQKLQWRGQPVLSGGGGFRVQSGPNALTLRVSSTFPPPPDPCASASAEGAQPHGAGQGGSR